MSLTRALIATRGSRDRFRELFLQVWGYYRLVETSPELNSLEEFNSWAEPRCEYLKGEPAHDVKAFWQEGDWSVLLDIATHLIDEPARLAALSREVGTLAAGLTQGTSGTAMFSLFEGGVIRREISRSDGTMWANFGEPLPAESGMCVAETFYVDELDRVWAGLGMAPFWSDPKTPLIALHLIETADYGPPPLPANGRKKPWWKFWGGK